MQKYYTRKNGTIGCDTINEEKTMTDQQFRDDCDVNIILKRLMAGQATPLPMSNKGVFGDFTNMPSYQESLQNVINANDAFMTLPSGVRTRFQNDPQQLMDFLNDKENVEESIKLGLRVKVPEKKDEHLDALKEIRENTKPKKHSSKDE